ncbi:MAG: TonB-dependent receptor, partial [Burkholderiales bacterium]|nr:TonB-dependent receptor [Burkholderiales bacterium]
LVQSYVINNYLDLYSNFEYGADSQFNQRDSRVTSGINAPRTLSMSGLGKEAANTFGVQIQHDQISNGLLSARQRQRNRDDDCFLEQCRRDRIAQSSIGVYAENHVHWNDWFRTVAGLRGDYFRFANTGLSSQRAGGVSDNNQRLHH